ncbi:hypothetical protein L226DRAFT_523824 [Lentinus tigrinus ALCF2SS1-7]|uniref:uncharacterized protein n=1 Tax=Lentinus tigrinus ALCF2SS1-7 TaxID=1328758 RepID=UPI00116633CD|nr:hypothetical protein L226DRAFT_523824 [Lentinus tigrinus ALCF2SS1-7]
MTSTPSGYTVSSIFRPDFAIGQVFPDLILVSSDHVHFHVHRQRLYNTSCNAFGGFLLQQSSLITIPQSAEVFNIVLHVVYGMSCLEHNPSLEAIEKAINTLTAYGVPIQHLARPSFPLYQLLVSQAPFHPIETYAIAGQHKLEDAAVATSAHLLAYELSNLTDEITVKMGPLYLRRLLDLQQTRMTALKEIVLRPPANHSPTAKCPQGRQEKLTQAWALAAAQLVWDTLPSISTHALKSTFEKAGPTIACPDCRAMLHMRIQEVMQEWSSVKRTI